MSERHLETATGIKSIKFLNNFVVNGYGVSQELGGEASVKIYEPEPGKKQRDLVRLVFGVGTGLGACILARPSEDVPFQVYPSEAGMARMQFYNKADRDYYHFIKEVKGYTNTPNDGAREDVSMILGGCALPWLAEFYSSLPEAEVKYEQGSLLYKEIKRGEKVKPEAVTSLAEREKDVLALDCVNHLLMEYSAKYLADLSLMVLPFGGVYLTGSFYNVGMRFALAERKDLKDKFLEKYQNRGSAVELLKKFPLTLVLRRDLALLGCLNYSKNFHIKK
jgi:glucokinase